MKRKPSPSLGEKIGKAVAKKVVGVGAKWIAGKVKGALGGGKAAPGKRVPGKKPKAEKRVSITLAASTLGHLGLGIAKTLTEKERRRRSRSLAEARKFRWA